MTEQELILMVIDEITEYKLSEYRQENRKVYDKLNAELTQLGDKMQIILSELPQEKSEIIQSYISKNSSLADMDCTFLYMQGAKDCVKLLKKLGVI